MHEIIYTIAICISSVIGPLAHEKDYCYPVAEYTDRQKALDAYTEFKKKNPTWTVDAPEKYHYHMKRWTGENID